MTLVACACGWSRRSKTSRDADDALREHQARAHSPRKDPDMTDPIPQVRTHAGGAISANDEIITVPVSPSLGIALNRHFAKDPGFAAILKEHGVAPDELVRPDWRRILRASEVVEAAALASAAKGASK